jgi:hypothetical protein
MSNFDVSTGISLQPGLSEQQRVAAATARQKLIEDLQAQVAEKAAREAVAAAADAARAALEDAALQSYHRQQQQQQQQLQQASSSEQQQAQHQWADVGPLNLAALVGTQSASNVFPVPSNAATAGAALSVRGGRKGRAKHVIDAPWLDEVAAQQQSQQSLVVQQHQQQHAVQQLMQEQHEAYPSLPSPRGAASTSAMPAITVRCVTSYRASHLASAV